MPLVRVSNGGTDEPIEIALICGGYKGIVKPESSYAQYNSGTLSGSYVTISTTSSSAKLTALQACKVAVWYTNSTSTNAKYVEVNLNTNETQTVGRIVTYAKIYEP